MLNYHAFFPFLSWEITSNILKHEQLTSLSVEKTACMVCPWKSQDRFEESEFSMLLCIMNRTFQLYIALGQLEGSMQKSDFLHKIILSTSWGRELEKKNDY